MDASIKTTPIGIAILIASILDLLSEKFGVGVADDPEGGTVKAFVLVEADTDDTAKVEDTSEDVAPVKAGAEVSVKVNWTDEYAEYVGLAGVPNVVLGVAVKRAVAAVVNTLPATPLTRLQKSGSWVVYEQNCEIYVGGRV